MKRRPMPLVAGSNPPERVTVDFEDEKDLNAEVTRCNTNIVTLALETTVPHAVSRTIDSRLGKVEVGGDSGEHTRDPDEPLHYGRLHLSITQKKTQWVSALLPPMQSNSYRRRGWKISSDDPTLLLPFVVRPPKT